MAKSSKQKQNVKSQKGSGETVEFSEKTEKIFKWILRAMTWIVAIASVTILVLPLFDDPTLDTLTRIIFNFGLSTLLVFTVIEFAAKPIKLFIEFIISNQKNG